MRDVVDPELGINVVDLGLVYGVHVDDDHDATIDMTLTSAACPLTDVIEDQTRQALEGLVDGLHGSTGSGCRRGARTRSPTTAARSCAPSASTSDALERRGSALSRRAGAALGVRVPACPGGTTHVKRAPLTGGHP